MVCQCHTKQNSTHLHSRNFGTARFLRNTCDKKSLFLQAYLWPGMKATSPTKIYFPGQCYTKELIEYSTILKQIDCFVFSSLLEIPFCTPQFTVQSFKIHPQPTTLGEYVLYLLPYTPSALQHVSTHISTARESISCLYSHRHIGTGALIKLLSSRDACDGVTERDTHKRRGQAFCGMSHKEWRKNWYNYRHQTQIQGTLIKK